MNLDGNELATLFADIKQAEGWKPEAYQDSVGVWTIGYGTNLQELTINRTLGEQWLQERVLQSEHEAQRFEWYARLNAPRKRAIVELIYNMGLRRFVGFIRMIGALDRGNYGLAATELMTSKYASQVGVRATRLAAMLRGPHPGDAQ